MHGPGADKQIQAAGIEKRIDASIASMSLEEKISLLSGGSVLGSTPLPRLGIPAFRMGDGPIGAHDPSPSTAFAAGIALTATWDRDLSNRIGIQIGRDSRSRGAAFLLGPGVNIYRMPMNGRNEEYFGEDPFLAGQIAVPYIEGVQSQGVSATIKHLSGTTRNSRASTPIPLSANGRFVRSTCRHLRPRCARRMSAPSWILRLSERRVDTDNARLNVEIVKKQWGFDGVIMSDWVATHDGVGAANGGLDLEMPAGLYFNDESLIPAIKSGKVSVDTIDDKIRRMLRLAARFGWISPAPLDLAGSVMTPWIHPFRVITRRDGKSRFRAPWKARHC